MVDVGYRDAQIHECTYSKHTTYRLYVLTDKFGLDSTSPLIKCHFLDSMMLLVS